MTKYSHLAKKGEQPTDSVSLALGLAAGFILVLAMGLQFISTLH